MSMRPKTVWVFVIWPSPSKSLKLPLTDARPHIDLALNPIVERPGSTFQTPTDAGLLRSSCVLAMSPPLWVDQWGNVRWIEVFVDAADQTVGAQLDYDADPHRDRSAVAAVGVQDVLLHEPAVEQLAVEDLVAAIDGRVYEPGDDPQRAFLVAVAGLTGLPDGDVGVPQLLHHRDIALLDRLEQTVGHVGDGRGVGHGHQRLLTTDGALARCRGDVRVLTSSWVEVEHCTG